MIDTVQTLATELRAINVPVATSDVITAMEALQVIDMAQRETVRTALASSLVRNAYHRPAFDLLFDQLFTAPESATSPNSFADLNPTALQTALVDALREGNTWMQRTLAATLVNRHAGIKPGRSIGSAYYVQRVLSAINIDELADQVVATTYDNQEVSSLRIEHLRRQRSKSTITEFERMIDTAVRTALASLHDDTVRPAGNRPMLPEDTEILSAAEQTISQLGRLIGPLARRLAAGAERQRSNSSTNAIDVRRSLRLSRATGGIPLRLAFKQPRPIKPRLIVLGDISGSVARFSLFAIQLAIAMRESFSSLRAYVFVDVADEITGILRQESSVGAVAAVVNRNRLGIRADDSSDYGTALRSFADRYGATIDRRTTVLIVGDARGNTRESGLEALKLIGRQAHAVHLLVPEPRELWGAGDSLVWEYSPHCSSVVECRSLRQLSAFIDSLPM